MEIQKEIHAPLRKLIFKIIGSKNESLKFIELKEISERPEGEYYEFIYVINPMNELNSQLQKSLNKKN